jgi:hypothetical protein
MRGYRAKRREPSRLRELILVEPPECEQGERDDFRHRLHEKSKRLKQDPRVGS